MTKNSTSKGIATVIGLDLADMESRYVGIDDRGSVVEEGTAATTQAGLEKMLRGRPESIVAIEAGTHSPWVSRLLGGLGHQVVVANPRQVALIYRSKRKSDRLDAMTLARLARSDPELLYPLTHRGEEAQVALGVLRSRAALVSARTNLINHVRGSVKSFGGRIPSCSAEAFAARAIEYVPAPLRAGLLPVVEEIASLTARIRSYDKEVARLISQEYREALVLQQVDGVGPITSLTYVLTIENPGRFATSRDVPAYLGLTPGRRQTGASDPAMRITKAGDVFLRRTLVQSAQYILGPFGKESDLRDWGLRIAGPPVEGRKGRRLGKKRAVIAVARKLAVLLHSLWTTGEVYEPRRQGVDLARAS